jgi:hypothetical protein
MMVAIAMKDFRDRQEWKEARLLTAVLHQVSDSFPAPWSLRFRQGAVGLLVALTNPDPSLSSDEASRLCDNLLSDLQSARNQQLIESELFERLYEEASLLSGMLKQNQPPTRT